MCLLVLRLAGAEPDWSALENGFMANSDGAGFCVHVPGHGLVVSKGYFTFESFRRAYEPVSDLLGMVHFRIGTSGRKDAANTHPFDIGGIHGRTEFKNLCAVGHNGIIPIAQPDKRYNDTYHFTKACLYPLWKGDRSFFLDERTCKYVDSKIGMSKLAFVDHEGRHAIIGERYGEWTQEGKVWYSNDSYLSGADRWGARWYGSDDVTDCGTPEALANLGTKYMDDWHREADESLAWEIDQMTNDELMEELVWSCGDSWEFVESLSKRSGWFGLASRLKAYYSATEVFA